jgi:hypothetical protein
MEMRKILVILSVLLCSFSVCMAGNKSTHAPSSDCPQGIPGFATPAMAYPSGYYGVAMDLSKGNPPAGTALLCKISYKDDEVSQNMCRAGAYDALQDKGKALRCWAELQRDIEGK